MCELQWDALAEIYLTNQDNTREIVCLCSRVFIRNGNNSDFISDSTSDSTNKNEESTEYSVLREQNSLTLSKVKTELNSSNINSKLHNCTALSGITYLSATDHHSSASQMNDSSYHTCQSTQGEESECNTSPISRKVSSRCGLYKIRTERERKRKYRSPSPTRSRKAYLKTGLTGEMEILRVDSTSSPKGVTFSTPVPLERPSKLKSTRFEVAKKLFSNGKQ
ncbi:hypothetical protein NQ317_004865 [Molorchus minor]|uniref:Uncharacterized protein n=1 Tax=Molorchus minor TaxID=1323400 RepID=A0ABQ9J857_9CUCU|nr:hypothetical protein NQ317_004865 [Molorchus minor]